jgi:hypothetical protein
LKDATVDLQNVVATASAATSLGPAVRGSFGCCCNWSAGKQLQQQQQQLLLTIVIAPQSFNSTLKDQTLLNQN